MRIRTFGLISRLLGLLVIALACVACNMTNGLVSSPRTPIEQMLLTQSLLRSLDHATIPLRVGDSVELEAAWPPTHLEFEGDLQFATSVVASWLAQQGVAIGGHAQRTPAYRIRVLLHAFGLDKQDVFFGVPPIQSILFPIALPELTLYRNLRNRGYTRLSIDITDTTTGRLISMPSVVEASVIFQRYTVLFLFSWQSTDLVPPPL